MYVKRKKIKSEKLFLCWEEGAPAACLRHKLIIGSVKIERKCNNHKNNLLVKANLRAYHP